MMMCGVGLVDRMSTDVPPDMMGVVGKIKYIKYIEDMIIQSWLQWYGHVGSCVKTWIKH